ncbi:MAG: hypothetical protein R6X20_04790, partial [Phycisphaerae bacterium]
MPPRSLIALAACLPAACALAGGCLSEEAARRTLRKDDPRMQAAMIARIAREKKTSMTDDLIRLLDSEDEGVRFMAATALHRVTGIDRGFHFADEDERKAIIEAWHRWYEDETGHPVPELEPEPPDDAKAEEPGDDADADEDADASA